MDTAKVNKEGVGTKATGYARPENGPFRCDNCIWYNNSKPKYPRENTCSHKEVIADSEVPKTEDNKLAKVAPAACCNHFWPARKLYDIPFEKVGL